MHLGLCPPIVPYPLSSRNQPNFWLVAYTEGAVLVLGDVEAETVQKGLTN
jgi:hypothetical protein